MTEERCPRRPWGVVWQRSRPSGRETVLRRTVSGREGRILPPAAPGAGFARGVQDGEDAPDRNRTCGLSLRRAALYPLSYGRVGEASVATAPSTSRSASGGTSV